MGDSIEENGDKLEAVEAFIEEELLLDDTYFQEDEDDWEEEDDDELEDHFLLSDDYFSDLEEDEYDDFDAGEEWKELSDDFTFTEYGSIDNLQVFENARIYAADVQIGRASCRERG